jgi:hypothetical protein
MGELIRFQPRLEENRRRPSHVSGATEGEGAKILLFLGVRYERHDGATPFAPKGQAKRGRNRKRA